jgi:hypothetical protein
MIVWGGIPGTSELGLYAAVNSNTPELCNGLNDDCDQAIDEDVAVPAAVAPVQASKSGTDISLAWDVVAAAQSYDVVRGGLASLLASEGDFSIATNGCIADDVAAGPVDDGELPPSGDALWYLVRAANCGGAGSYDEGGAGQAAPRDAEIELPASACP